MTIFTFSNNVNTTLAGAVSTGATMITLASTQNLPTSIPSGQVLVITLNDAATRGNYEIVYATAISGATLTVLRGQEGTSALAWLTGDYAFSPPTAGQMSSMGQLSANNTWGGSNNFNNPVAVGNATSSGHAITKGQAESEFALINGSATQQFNVQTAGVSTNAVPIGQIPSLFPSSIGQNGYKKYPDTNSPTGYFIEQWGFGTYPTQLTTTGQNFPIAFPNTCLNMTCSFGTAIPLTSFTSCGAAPTSNSQFAISVAAGAAGSDGVYWNAKGY